MRRAGPVITRLGGLQLVAAGACVGWYGCHEIRLLAGRATTDPVISAAVSVQLKISRLVGGLGAGTLLRVGDDGAGRGRRAVGPAPPGDVPTVIWR